MAVNNALLLFMEKMDALFAFAVWAMALPATLIFFGVAVFLTIKTNCIQLRGLVLTYKGLFVHRNLDRKKGTISPLHALFTSMASTIGMGNIIGPSAAVIVAGPGALLWLVIYMLLAGATKYSEVCFAVATRTTLSSGRVVGGPMRYLGSVSTLLASWYALGALCLFMCWSSMQSHTLAHVLAFHGIPKLGVGIVLAATIYVVLQGGITWISRISAQLVPVMFILYVICAVGVIVAIPQSLGQVFKTIFEDALRFRAITGGFLGGSVLRAMHVGMQRGVFITEAGLGTSSISHALANVSHPRDQGVLAMYSIFSDIILSLLSGFIVIGTGLAGSGVLRNTVVYEAFVKFLPGYGAHLFIAVALLFVFTTVLGNSFNGTQTVALLAGDPFVAPYQLLGAVVVIVGAILPVRFLWNLTDVLLLFVALPNAIGLTYLSVKKSRILK